MWQVFCLTALFCQAVEETIDKGTMVNNKLIDVISTTWIRNGLFLLITIIAAFIFDSSIPKFYFTLPIITLGILYGSNAIFYSLFLKKIEISASTVLASCMPLIFLPLDIFIVKEHLLIRQVVGILLLVLGSIIFFMRKGLKISKNYLFIVIGMFLFDAILFGFESYLFKDYFNTVNISETNFLLNTWAIAFVFLTIVLCFYNLKNKPKYHLPTVFRYMRGSFGAKIADYGNSFFFLRALTLATTSQVSSMNAFYPLLLILLVFIVQSKFKVNLEELLDKKSLLRKGFAFAIICCGSLLAS